MVNVKRPRDDESKKGGKLASLILHPHETALNGPEFYFAELCNVLADVSAITSRLEVLSNLVHFFLNVYTRFGQEGVLTAAYLAINRLAPAHHGMEMGVGDAILTKVVADICGITEKRVREEFQKTGDLAEVAQYSRQKQSTLTKPKPLLASHVLSTYRQIAQMSGKDTQRRRADTIKGLLRDAKGPEINFIIRALQGKMRIGVAETTVAQALGYAMCLFFTEGWRKLDVDDLQMRLERCADGFCKAYGNVPDLEIVLTAVGKHRMELLLHPAQFLSIRLGCPVRPQLAQPTTGVTVVLDRFDGRPFSCEYKYDGERAQIHFSAGTVKIYSRNAEDHTGKYPDVGRIIPLVAKEGVTSFIVDSEIVAVEAGKLLPFQQLQHRGRKNVEESEVEVSVCVFVFDILLLNDVSVMERSLTERRELLRANLTVQDGKFQFVTFRDSTDIEEIQEFLTASIADGCEGLMIKSLEQDSEYTPGKRTHQWLKLKKDYLDGCGDTLDLVPIGCYLGKGKRAGVFGGFLLACYNEDDGEYQSVCRIGTGFSESELERFTESLSQYVVQQKPRYYRTHDEPQMWLTESHVWEVKAADLSISPVHCAAVGMIEPSRGIALRFPRFLRVRDDKRPTDATTAAQIATMFRQQALTQAQVQPADDE